MAPPRRSGAVSMKSHGACGKKQHQSRRHRHPALVNHAGTEARVGFESSAEFLPTAPPNPSPPHRHCEHATIELPSMNSATAPLHEQRTTKAVPLQRSMRVLRRSVWPPTRATEWTCGRGQKEEGAIEPIVQQTPEHRRSSAWPKAADNSLPLSKRHHHIPWNNP